MGGQVSWPGRGASPSLYEKPDKLMKLVLLPCASTVPRQATQGERVNAPGRLAPSVEVYERGVYKSKATPSRGEKRKPRERFSFSV